MSVNKLTAQEARQALEQMITEFGCEGAASIAENFIEREAEKITADIKDPKERRGAELVVFRMILDKLERAYVEELNTHETGEGPTYKLS